ncbi:MAG: hypothetical protein Q8755_03335, partial [Candidatus Phytoplasma australasiaticum]|nr:hypothetical protein [Candidatus Phytoplasma australasiaticum]
VYRSVEEVLESEEHVLRRIHEIGTPIGSISDKTHHLLSALDTRFAVHDEEEEPQPFVVSWFLVLPESFISVTFSDGNRVVYKRSQILTCLDVGLLQQLHDIRASNLVLTPELEWNRMVTWRLYALLDLMD